MKEEAHGHGAKLTAQQLMSALSHILDTNQRRQGPEEVPTPVCIWGRHGVGKSEIVHAWAKARGWQFAYCAPAQFEEMGDLHGMPLVDESDGRTRFAPPDWVPVGVEGPGILLLDDVNRADDRILRGLMQLLQHHRMHSWELPSKWQIVATANPEGSDYSVTPMDDAMLTRFLHVTQVFDLDSWVRWASRAGVDSRGIAFALGHPELLEGHRTTARSLTQFFAQIADIEDLRAQVELVQILAASTLDDVTAASFVGFVMDELDALISPIEILETEDFSKVSARLEETVMEGSALRIDRLSAISTRLFLELTAPTYEPSSTHQANLISFLLDDILPNDLRVSLHRDLTHEGGDAVRKMMRDKKLAKLMLEGM